MYFLIWYRLEKKQYAMTPFRFVMWLRFAYWCLNNYFLDQSIKQSKQNNKLFTGKTFLVALFSSNINEGIRAVLFFKRKDFTLTKSIKTHISEQRQKKGSLDLREGKSLIHLFEFLCFLCVFCAFCAFCAFLCMKQKIQHFYAHKSI